MSVDIHFYGERGLVNAIFLDLRQHRKVAEFLRAIEFHAPEPHHLDIPDDAEITVIVEAGFGNNRNGFGWPDAIVSARTAGAHFVLIFEVKVGLYQLEAEDFTATREAGFNSTINGQFSLRYRLAAALQNSHGRLERLLEPLDLARAYGEERMPRRLAKPENLAEIVEPHLLEATEYLFVALTDDAENPWTIAEREVQELLPYLAAPLPSGSIPEPWTVDNNRWNEERSRFGWVNFASVEPLVERGDYFRLARGFLDAKRAAARRRAAVGIEPGVGIQPRNWDEAPRPAETQSLRDEIRRIIREEAATLGLTYDERSGSDSLIAPGGRRLLKLMAPVRRFRDSDIVVGVAVGMGGLPQSLQDFSLGTIRIQTRGFEAAGLKIGDLSADDLREAIRDAISNVTDCQDADRVD